MLRLPAPTLQRLRRCGLLGRLLRAPITATDHLAVDGRVDLETAIVRGSRLVDDGIGHAGAVARQQLLQGGLEVEELVGRDLDLAVEGRDGGLRRRLVAVVEIAGADRRLAERRERSFARLERRDVD